LKYENESENGKIRQENKDSIRLNTENDAVRQDIFVSFSSLLLKAIQMARMMKLQIVLLLNLFGRHTLLFPQANSQESTRGDEIYI
jgi:hypothetical protein